MAESKVLKIYIEKVQCANKDGSLALEGLENTEAFVRGASLACPQKRVVKSVVLWSVLVKEEEEQEEGRLYIDFWFFFLFFYSLALYRHFQLSSVGESARKFQPHQQNWKTTLSSLRQTCPCKYLNQRERERERERSDRSVFFLDTHTHTQLCFLTYFILSCVRFLFSATWQKKRVSWDFCCVRRRRKGRPRATCSLQLAFM